MDSSELERIQSLKPGEWMVSFNQYPNSKIQHGPLDIYITGSLNSDNVFIPLRFSENQDAVVERLKIVEKIDFEEVLERRDEIGDIPTEAEYTESAFICIEFYYCPNPYPSLRKGTEVDIISFFFINLNQAQSVETLIVKSDGIYEKEYPDVNYNLNEWNYIAPLIVAIRR